MSATVGMQYVFYSAAIFYALACIALFFIGSQHAINTTRQVPQEKQSSYQLLKNRKLVILSVFFASLMFTLMIFRPFFTKFVRDVYLYDNFHIGILGSVLFFGSAVLGIWLGRFGDKRRKSSALAISLLMCSASTFIVAFSDSYSLLLVAFFVAGGSYLTWSLMGAIVAPLAPESIRARWISIPQTLSMFASFVAPYIGGILYDASPYYPMYFAVAATFVIALLSFKKVLNS